MSTMAVLQRRESKSLLMQKPMHAASPSPSLIPHMPKDVLGSIRIFNHVRSFSDSFWHPLWDGLQDILMSGKFGRLDLVVEHNGDTASMVGDDAKGIYEVLIWKTTVQALCMQKCSIGQCSKVHEYRRRTSENA